MHSATNILRVITRLNIGGPARQALLLSKKLGEFPTTLVAGRPTAAEGELTDPDVPITYLPLVRPVSPTSDLRAAAGIRRLLVERRPALVHTNMAKAGTITRGMARTLRQRPVTVHTFHGHVLDGYFRPSVERAFVAVERRLAHHTDALVAVSEEVRSSLLGLGIGRPEQIRVIELGFDLRAHHAVAGRSGRLRDRFGIDDAPLIGMVGRLVPIKDHDTALRAIALVRDAHLVIVGDGETRPRVESLVAELGLNDRVHFAGWQDDIPAVMADLDVALLTSRNEGTPVSLIEAAASGRAAVATAVGGVAAVVDDGVTGILVPPADPHATAAAIEAVLEDDTRRVAMGRAGRLRSVRWSDDRLVADIRALYRELLS